MRRIPVINFLEKGENVSKTAGHIYKYRYENEFILHYLHRHNDSEYYIKSSKLNAIYLLEIIKFRTEEDMLNFKSMKYNE